MSTAERSGPGRRPVQESAFDDITARGAAAFRDTKAGLDDVMADVGEKGREALRGARDVRDTFTDALLTSVRERPYTALAIAGALGFAYGALRRR